MKSLNTLLKKAKNHSRIQSYAPSISSTLIPQNKCEANDCYSLIQNVKLTL